MNKRDNCPWYQLVRGKYGAVQHVGTGDWRLGHRGFADRAKSAGKAAPHSHASNTLHMQLNRARVVQISEL